MHQLLVATGDHPAETLSFTYIIAIDKSSYHMLSPVSLPLSYGTAYGTLFAAGYR